jgi:outer membrane protein assembly factor BamB
LFRTLGMVSGKDVQRPVQFVPPDARFSDLIAVGDMVYAATSQRCGGAPNGIWALSTSGDGGQVVSWKTNGGDPLGSVAFTTTGALIAAIGGGATAAGGYANAVVSLDPETLELKDRFSQSGIEPAAAPIVFEEGGRNVVALTTKNGRVLLLDAASLGGANHATPLFASQPLTSGRATFTTQSPAMWQERPGAEGGADGTRWLLIPVTDGVLAVKVTYENGAFAIQPGWTSENMSSPATPIVVNGVVFAVSGADDAPARLYALDGATGKTLWQSGSAMTSPMSGRSFWTGSGHVFVGATDGTVHAFGFDMERGAPNQRKGS